MKKGSNRRQTERKTWKQKKYGNNFKEPRECVCQCIKECKADTVKQLKIFKKKPEDPNSSIIFGTLIWLHPKPTESHDPAISILQNSPRDFKTQPRLRITALNLESKTTTTTKR